MVWFHGGGFVSGQASMYGPEHLMDRDVILVTVSYRLGPLGFFSLGKIYYSQINCIQIKICLFLRNRGCAWKSRNVGPTSITTLGSAKCKLYNAFMEHDLVFEIF